jgi:hypothetical protein
MISLLSTWAGRLYTASTPIAAARVGSLRLTQLAKAGEITKASHGYSTNEA